MKICTIIPCFDHAEYVGNAITSVFRQSVDATLEVIVVDDGSCDDTAAVLANMAQELDGLNIVLQPHQGVAAARNAGIEALPQDCDVVAFLDSDDLMCAGRFRPDLKAFAADPDLDMTFGKIQMVDALDYVTGTPRREARCRQLDAAHLSAVLFRRQFLARVGWFDTGFAQAEDTDFLLRAFEAAPNFAQTGTPCIHFLRHARNMINDAPAARRGFLKALQHSVARRRADPSISVLRPALTMRSLADLEFR